MAWKSSELPWCTVSGVRLSKGTSITPMLGLYYKVFVFKGTCGRDPEYKYMLVHAPLWVCLHVCMCMLVWMCTVHVYMLLLYIVHVNNFFFFTYPFFSGKNVAKCTMQMLAHEFLIVLTFLIHLQRNTFWNCTERLLTSRCSHYKCNVIINAVTQRTIAFTSV